MEKITTRTTHSLQPLFLFSLFLLTAAATSHSLHSDPIFSQSPTPSPPSTSIPSNPHRHLRGILLGVLFGSLTGFLASLLVVFSIRHFLFYANPILRGPVVFAPNISPRTLQSALSDETQMTQLLSSGATGKYYRVTLDDGLVVAVKRVEPNWPDTSPPAQSNSAKRRVQQGLEMLAMVKHRNVMSLRAYVRENDRFSLVYDYVPNGSLEDVMKRVRSNHVQLGWDARHGIAVGVVKGLRYLHFECSPRILHYNLKPANVMLDEEFGPMLGDCGVVRLIGGGGGGGDSDFCGAGSSCYVAPECFQSCRYTDKSDIFSFGVILAMLLTGRDPADPFFGGESGSLGRWIRHLQQVGEARQALDKGILGEEVEEDEMLMAVRIAVVCLSDLPADRPSSDELVAMLTQLHSF